MSTMKSIVWAAAMTVCAAAAIAQDANTPEGWPRTFEKDGYSVTMYQPQVDGWKDYSKIRFRAAIAVTSEKTGEVQYGALAVQADTLVDHEARTVLLTNLDGAVNFPGLPADQAAELRKPVMDLLAAKTYVNVSLDRILAYMHNKTQPRVADINMSPPPIYYSDVPAIMVIYIGQPRFKPVSGTDLMFAVNTNWAVFLDKASSRYYLLDEDCWLTAPDPVKGPWTGAESLPGGLSRLPAGKAWDEIRKNVPGNPPPANIPKVYASTTPAELIVTNGPPVYAPVSGTRLMYVSNPEMPVFMDLINNEYYYLVSGRWFEAADLNGPWSAASADLPAEFAKIPADSPIGYVLASVPGTQEAQDAVMLAEVPHKATVNIENATVNVTYSGEPKFEPIKGTDMKYAVNTAYQVIYADQQYYCCYNGVWFVAPVAAGPWAVCASVPAVIYTIPATSPLYNVTYVKVYSYTPDTVVVGYTGGYSGEYVAATGALMFGAGLAVGAALSWPLLRAVRRGGLGRRVQSRDRHVGESRIRVRP
jgi:hypothetical protein